MLTKLAELKRFNTVIYDLILLTIINFVFMLGLFVLFFIIESGVMK